MATVAGSLRNKVLVVDDLTSGDITVTDLVVSGTVTLQGTATTLDSTNTTITDSIIELNSGLTGANTKDIGFVFERGSTGNNAAFIWDESADRFTVITTTGTAADNTLSGTVANFQAGSFFGNGANLTALNGTNITSGTIADARLPGDISSNVTGYANLLKAEDNRTISSSELTPGRMKFGFTSWANDNTAPYADFIHLNSYTDSSGGNDNLLTFKKSGKGMRLWQSSYNSATAYSSYSNVMLDRNNLGTITGNTSQDFNDYSNTGTAYVSNWPTGTGTANGPSHEGNAYGWGMLRVTEFIDTNYVVQEYIPHNDDGAFIRVKWNGTWGPWRQSWTSRNDGAGSGLDADKLDGQQGSHYLNYNNLTNTPTIPSAFNGGTITTDLTISNSSPALNLVDTNSFSDAADRMIFRAANDKLQWQWYDNSANTTTTILDLDKTGLLISDDHKLNVDHHLQRSDHHSGHLEGSYNNVGANGEKTNPIYTIGSAYNPASTTLGTMYGIGYSKNTASFMTGALDAGDNNGWGLYVAADGDARIFLNASDGIINSTGEHYVNSNRVFHDGYHPNADKWTTARTITLGGDLSGNVSIDGSANVTLTATVANDSHNHNHSDGNFTVNGVLQAGAGSNHISTAAAPFRWQRSTASQTGQDDNVSVYVDDSNIYFTHNNDSDGDASSFNFRYTTGGTATNLLNFSSSTMTYKGQTVFHDGYHPNADKWTTARSHTVTLTGDVTGTASQSVDGTGNKTWTVNTAVANDSHNHTKLFENATITFGASQFQWMDQNGTGGTGLNGAAPRNPINGWYHNLIMNHANGNGYYSQLSFGLNTDDAYFSRVANGTAQSFQRIFADNYHPNADKWTTARTITLGGDLSGNVSIDGSANVTLTATVANDSHTHDGRYYTESESDARFTSRDHFRHTGHGNYTSTTTSALLTEALGDDAFDSKLTAHKTSWSYAGNGDLTDAGRLTELAGSSWLWWTDNSTDNVQGNITGLCIAPNTGGSAGKMFVYNNQGSSYSPGWREIWTSRSDGAGSGLDADLLDGQQGSHYLAWANVTGKPTIPTNNNQLTNGASYITASNAAITNKLPKSGGTMTGDLTIPNKIIHSGDTNTYMAFPAGDEWNVYCGGVRMIKAVEASAGNDYISFFDGTGLSGAIYFDSLGNGHFDANVTAYSTQTGSDKRLKENITPLENSLDKVLSLDGVMFDWKKESRGKDQIGFIAQQVEEHVPELVGSMNDIDIGEAKTVNYEGVVPMLVEALKEQQSIINRLESRIKDLEDKG